MKFTKGLILGSIITAGVLMMYADGKMDNKKMMKTGRKLMKKVGMM